LTFKKTLVVKILISYFCRSNNGRKIKKYFENYIIENEIKNADILMEEDYVAIIQTILADDSEKIREDTERFNKMLEFR